MKVKAKVMESQNAPIFAIHTMEMVILKVLFYFWRWVVFILWRQYFNLNTLFLKRYVKIWKSQWQLEVCNETQHSRPNSRLSFSSSKICFIILNVVAFQFKRQSVDKLGWQDSLSVCTFIFELLSLGLNNRQAINCHPDVSQARQLVPSLG